MKTVLIFQGGGPLGAFGCGAWQALAPWLAAEGHPVVALGGTSIGAFNAALIRPHLGAPDGGAGELARVWRDRIAVPSLPFLGMPWGTSPWASELRSWNGLLTGMFAGNGLYTPNLPGWSPWGLLHRTQAPLFDRARMWRLMTEELPPYRSQSPRDALLFAASADVADGTLVLHDSDAAEVGPVQVGASSAMPVLFDPVPIDGRLQWDGELVRASPLEPVLRKVRDSGRAGRDEPLLLVTVEQMPQPAARLPRSGPELAYRALNLTQIGKLAAGASRGLHCLRVARPALPSDGVSGLFDHSNERIDDLIALGAEAARAAVAGGQAARPAATEVA